MGREALEAKAKALQSQMQGLVSSKPVPSTRPEDPDMAGKLRSEGADPVASGFDVAIVRDDLISEFHTVITKVDDRAR